MTSRSQVLTFHLACPEPRAWLVIQCDDQEPQVVEMWSGYPNHWSASAWLAPGQYRCRYYCGDDHRVVYGGPARINGSFDEGMDGLVSVKPQRDKMDSNSTNILLVEDNLTTLRALENLLKQDGYLVHVAEGYQTALAVARQNRVDVAICDINLWDGDGCELLVELQKMQSMKAIAVTGYTLPEETEHYRDAGFGVVLRKPVQHSEILSAIALLQTAPQGMSNPPVTGG